MLPVFAFFIFLAFAAYYISMHKTNFINRAGSDLIPLDDNTSSQAMLLDYAEVKDGITNHQLRIEVSRSLLYRPSSLYIGEKELKLTETRDAYKCMSMDDGEHEMRGFQTEFFTLDSDINMDNTIKVLFTDANGKTYSSTYSIEHSCSRLMDLKTDNNPPAISLPRE